MIPYNEYRAILTRMQALLEELDRQQLATVAVQVDLALNRLEDIIVSNAEAAKDIPGN